MISHEDLLQLFNWTFWLLWTILVVLLTRWCSVSRPRIQVAEPTCSTQSVPFTPFTPQQTRPAGSEATSTPTTRRRTPRSEPLPAEHRHLNLASESSHWRFYAVAYGRRIGIFRDWETCREQVQGFPGAQYRGFNCVIAATRWLGWYR